MRSTARNWAMAGITVVFLALIRSLAEILRLSGGAGAAFTLDDTRRWVGGALIAATLLLAAVVLFFLRRYRGVTAVAALTVAALLVYRFTVLR